MASPTTQVGPRDGARPRFGRRMDEILRHAADVFCEKGYEGASMRDLSRATKMSLAGLYYYFESKEKLLYLIQRHTFITIREQLRERLEDVAEPQQRLRVFIDNHLEYFLAHRKAMKVLSHESDALTGAFRDELRAIKRDYFRTCVDLVQGAMTSGRSAGVQSSRPEARIAALSLFGMMNWIYTWYNPRLDGDAAALGAQMSEIFLHGVLCGAHASAKPRGRRASQRKP